MERRDPLTDFLTFDLELIHCRGGSRIFERGGGSRRGYRIFHKHPPLDIARVTSSALRKIENHPHSWTFTSTPVTHTHPGSATGGHLRYTNKKGGSKRGSNFGPNVKKPTSWPKRGGPDPLDPPPPRIRHCTVDWGWLSSVLPLGYWVAPHPPGQNQKTSRE